MLEPGAAFLGRKHTNFRRRYGGRGEYGLDFVKAMPAEWTDEQRWASMVELYDELLDAYFDRAPSGQTTPLSDVPLGAGHLPDQEAST